MKIRTDFVTNSSSSSFIVVLGKEFKDYKSDNIAIQKIINYQIGLLRNYADSTINNEDSLMNYLTEHYNKEQLQIMVNEKTRGNFKEYIDLINEGKEILYLENVDDCSQVYTMLREIGHASSELNVICVDDDDYEEYDD